MTGLFQLAMSLRFIQVVVCIRTSFHLRLNNIPLYVYITLSSIHPSFFKALKDNLHLAPLAEAKVIVFPAFSGNEYEGFGNNQVKTGTRTPRGLC